MSKVNYYAQVNVNLRAGPSTKEAIIGEVPKGAILVTTMAEGAPAGKPGEQVTVGSPYEAGGDLWVYGAYGKKSGWAAFTYKGKHNLAGDAPAKTPVKEPTNAVTTPDNTTKTDTNLTTPPAQESSPLPMLFGAAAVVFLIMAITSKK